MPTEIFSRGRAVFRISIPNVLMTKDDKGKLVRFVMEPEVGVTPEGDVLVGITLPDEYDDNIDDPMIRSCVDAWYDLIRRLFPGEEIKFVGYVNV